jgi:integrase
MRGAPLFTVQKLLGHSNPRMTQRYARLAPGTLADAVAMLDGTK